VDADILAETGKKLVESVEVAGVDASFGWQLDAHVGTVTPQGVVTVTGEPGATGQLVVSWGGTQTQIPVAVAREPLPVEEFEAPPVWAAAAIKARGSAARAFVDPELALFGDGLLRGGMITGQRPRTAPAPPVWQPGLPALPGLTEPPPSPRFRSKACRRRSACGCMATTAATGCGAG
jgi:hypothetical protein